MIPGCHVSGTHFDSLTEKAAVPAGFLLQSAQEWRTQTSLISQEPRSLTTTHFGDDVPTALNAFWAANVAAPAPGHCSLAPG
jgi:hypothetical protein